ncbi:MAG: hypothetical protein ACKV2U_04800 [Bryobacteraceae bacterium]
MADNTELKDITSAVEDAVTYPLLTKEVNGYGRGSRNGDTPGSSGGGSLTRTAQGAIRDLLGWRYRVGDPKGFLAALNKAVDLKEIEGHVQSTWKARPFMVQADLGEVTGAQASIYERAKVAVEHALPLLDALTPLRPDADDQSTESMRAMVRSALSELVTELGSVGGPRIHRVNDYFRRLLGINEFDPVKLFGSNEFKDLVGKPENVKGKLGELRERFGLKRALVLTVEEERTFTNFLILVDYTTSLLQTWVAQKSFIERNGSPDKFLGTQLVRLSQALNVIVESVHQAYDAMDSVFFGPEEREVKEIEFDGNPRITVAELLGWVEHFASIEAPQLIEDSGKDGVDAVKNTLEQLRELVKSAVSQSQNL